MKKTDALVADYQALWGSMVVRPDWTARLLQVIRRIELHKDRYAAVAAECGSIPWEWIAAIHNMESSGLFNRHLHNGDPLSARTRNVPAGRPVAGKPPFSWEESALDALKQKGLHKIQRWTVSEMLYQAERYNGFGYRRYHPTVRTPYLWSGTIHYVRGKYVRDGKFSATAVSDQVGVAPILGTYFAMGGLKK